MRIALDALLFLAAFALPFAAARRRARTWGTPAEIALAPDADLRDAARCLSELAVRLDSAPRRMRVSVSAPSGMTLDLAQDGRLVAAAPKRRPFAFDLRGRWIADHDLPLALDGATLFVEPTGANRFRVATSPDGFVRPSEFARVWIPVAASLACAAALAFLAPEPIVAVCGYALASSARRAWRDKTMIGFPSRAAATFRRRAADRGETR